ncbi:MAG: peptidylprolyl isomerase, partial [Candidatus Portnoybacteria bacterium CG08_land_8_20_14_0_20_40_83]
VADKIAKVAKDSNDKPLSLVIMKSVTVSEMK